MVVTQQKMVSGTVQEETDITQALDEWRRILQPVENQKETRQNAQ